MAKTNAQRQSEYRKQPVYVGDDGNKRFNTWVTSKTDYTLDLLCNHYGLTRREMLEKLVADADCAVNLRHPFGTPEWEKYHNLTSDSF